MQGTLYLGAQRGSEERSSIMQLHDDSSGVVIAGKCSGYILSHWPQYTERCAKLLPNYESYDFHQLMNSTFGLLPAGGSPGTHRLAEVRDRTLVWAISR